MAHMLDLPSELLTTIITFMVISSNDIRDWAHMTAVCKRIYTAAIQPNCLKLINCEPVFVVTRPETHQHINGLLSRCVRAENPTADSVMAKVILFGGPPLWIKIQDNDEANSNLKTTNTLPLSNRRMIAKSLITDSIADVPYIVFSMEEEPSLCEPYRRLHPLRLMKSLITHTGPFDLVPVFPHLKEFIFFLVGYPEFIESRIEYMLDDMYRLELKLWPYEHFRRRGQHHLDMTLKVTWESVLLADALTGRDRVKLALDKMIKM